MSNKTLFYLLLIFGLMQSCNYQYHHVFYGHQQDFSSQSQELFFDAEGSLYPSSRLDVQQYYNSGFPSLSSFYKANPEQFTSRLSNEEREELNVDQQIQRLQKIEIDQLVSQINSRSEQSDRIVFLIHGFNNIYEDSSRNYRLAKTEISEFLKDENVFFVDVYWDAMNTLTAKKMVKGSSPTYSSKIGIGSFLYSWKTAVTNSNYVGQQLRRVISNIEHSEISIITHSLGSNVALAALTNIEYKLDIEEDDEISHQLKQYLDRFNNHVDYASPQQQIQLGMIAPAIPGERSFVDFYHRTPAVGQTVDSTNINVTVGFNAYDPVLKKYFRVPQLYYATTLGCKRTDLETVIAQHKPYVTEVNFSEYELQKDHAFFMYLQNSRLKDFFTQVFRVKD